MKDPANKEGFVKIKMPKYYIAKHSDQDLHAAVLAERELCAKLCEAEGARIDASWESCAAAIRARGDMSTKSQNSDTSAERVHESDKSIHEPWNTSDMAHRSGGLGVEQEPVAYLCENAVGYKYFRWKKPTSHYKPIALYTAPPSKQEPVAAVELITIGSEQVIAVAWFDSNAFKVGTKLYTAPPKQEWVGLTDDEIEKSYETTGHCQTLRPQDKFVVFALARAIEAVLRSKNT